MRKLIFATFFVVAILSYIFRLDELIIKNFTFLNSFKTFYTNNILNISASFDKYFNQAKHIEELKNENKELKDYRVLYNIAKDELAIKDEFLRNLNLPRQSYDVELVKVVSYVSFNDFTKVFLAKKLQSDKILGLISDDFAAGIVVNQDETNSETSEKEIFEDIISLLHCFAMRMYSARRKKKITLVEEDLTNEISL